MAKIFGINGNISGKQGNNVFAILRGETILRKYQPIVANPNTQAQVQRRAMFKNASQLASIVPAQILSGLAPLARTKKIALRNAFASLNLTNGAFLCPANDTQIYPDKLAFSQGNLSKGNTSGLDFEESLEVSFSFENTELVARGGVNKILPFVWIRAINSFVVGQLTNLSAGVAVITMPPLTAGTDALVFAYYVHSDSEQAGVRYSSAFDAANFTVTAEFLQAAGALEYSKTIYVGSGTIS